MKFLSYEPQMISADELNTAIEMDTCFIVNEDGSVENSGNFAPNVWGSQGQDDPEIMNDPEHWEFLRGYTGQYGYFGPEMHVSEFLGGMLADDILNNPGEYALVPVRYECDEDYCGVLWEDDEGSCGDIRLKSWVVLRKI